MKKTKQIEGRKAWSKEASILKDLVQILFSMWSLFYTDFIIHLWGDRADLANRQKDLSNNVNRA